MPVHCTTFRNFFRIKAQFSIADSGETNAVTPRILSVHLRVFIIFPPFFCTPNADICFSIVFKSKVFQVRTLNTKSENNIWQTCHISYPKERLWIWNGQKFFLRSSFTISKLQKCIRRCWTIIYQKYQILQSVLVGIMGHSIPPRYASQFHLFF